MTTLTLPSLYFCPQICLCSFPNNCEILAFLVMKLCWAPWVMTAHGTQVRAAAGSLWRQQKHNFTCLVNVLTASPINSTNSCSSNNWNNLYGICFPHYHQCTVIIKLRRFLKHKRIVRRFLKHMRIQSGQIWGVWTKWMDLLPFLIPCKSGAPYIHEQCHSSVKICSPVLQRWF